MPDSFPFSARAATRVAGRVSAWLGQPARLPHEEPLRAELLSVDQLARFAGDLARQQTTAVGPGPDRLLPRLADNARILRASHEVLVHALAADRRLSPPAEWLLDNFYMIEQQIHLARLHLPRTYSQRLPRLTQGPMKGFPRIYQMAQELIAHQDGRLDAETATAFLASYQTVTPLLLGELWAFPISLRLGLIENLRRVAAHIARHRQDKDAGIAWAERALAAAEKNPKSLIRLLADFAEDQPTLTAPFLEEFLARLQGRGPNAAFILNWVDHTLAEQETTAAQLVHADGHAQAAEQISIANSIGSLRFLSAMDWKEFVETLSHVEQTLRRDPAGAHADQDFATRDRYRHVVEDLAIRAKKSENQVAQTALDLAAGECPPNANPERSRHIGFYLVDKGLPHLEKALGCGWSPRRACDRLVEKLRFPLYLGSILAGAVAVAGGAAWLAAGPAGPRFWLFFLLALIPASSLALSLTHFLVTLLVPPRSLPRFDFSKGIPSDHRTMVVVPALIQNREDVRTLLEALEIRHLGNRDPNLYFALLTDFPDAPEQTGPGDAELLASAVTGIQELNARHPRPGESTAFYLFNRPRVWNPHERIWMAWERKRGKLEQFNALLRGGPRDAFDTLIGDLSILRSIKYVITLDADTELPRATACRLVGALAHPLNRPRYDPARGRIVEGYAILQPRASIRLAAVGRSAFARLFAGEAGLDPYSREISDVYQDLFAEGSFVGKGIYDVDAFRQALDGRFPENVILSHDLIESAYARSALLSHVELYEEFPASYLADVSRQHRWIRGDWQIARWLFPQPPAGPRPPAPHSLSALSRWKILDNLRRSLFSPTLLAVLLAGWTQGARPAAAWTLFALAVYFLTGLLRTFNQLLRKPDERGWRLHLRHAAGAIVRQFAQPLLSLAFLPYEAVIALDAWFRATARRPFTRRGLLIWNLDQYRRRNAHRTPAGFAAEMAAAPALAVITTGLLAVARPEALAAALPLLALWLASPLIAWRLSRPIRHTAPVLSPAQQRLLRTLSRRTWRYFESFVGPDENWLPPDNFQEIPKPTVASRTSPTNMGLALLAHLSAWDFGYISTRTLLDRLGRMLDAMDALERYHGQFYNWYDTRTQLPLQPLYISSVDSGNLAGCLLTLRAGLLELPSLPALSPQLWQGFRDTLAVLADEAGPHAGPGVTPLLREAEALLADAPTDTGEARRRLAALRAAGARLSEAAAAGADSESPTEFQAWARLFEQQCADHAAAAEALLAPEPGPIPALAALAAHTGEPAPPATADPESQAPALVRAARRLAEHAHELETAMDFQFLFDKGRKLLSIGFDVGARRLDPGCYDLLASEARLASFLLIAGEQAPPDHWFALGRMLTGHDGAPALVSWSGSMFEYLMPALLMPHYPDTLLEQTCRAVIARQIRYGRQRHVPWGISESCYNATDAHHVYQYRAFGVPGLGLKRGLSDDLVIAPYATLLALPFAPVEACRNLERLAFQEDALGPYGLCEAVDYTPARVPRGKPRAVVRAYMAHHQGMGLLALSHLLHGAPMVRRFMADPAVRATELILQERVPQVSPVLQPHERESAATAPPAVIEPGALMRVFPDPHTVNPEVHLLSNGNYHVMVTHTGGGYSRWRHLALTRWREDATCDTGGAFVYLREVESAAVWSAAFQPTRRQAERYEAIFTQGRAEFRRLDHDVETHVEIAVSPEDDVEIRRFTFSNQARRKKRLEFTSYTELVLAPLAADLAHRAFSNLFLHTEILPDRHAILATRRTREESDEQPWLFHLLVVPGAAGTPSFETDRARFLGRGRTPADPAALLAPAGSETPLSNSHGFTLDPIAAIRLPLDLAVDAPTVAHLITGVAPTREAALALVDKYRDRHLVDRAFDMAWSHSQILLRILNASEADFQLYGRLAGSLIFAHARHRAAPHILARNRLGPPGLWRFGISGDLPILLLRIGDIRRLELVTEALRVHSYWRLKGLAADLLIVNEDYSGYRATLNDRIMAAITSGPDAGLLDKPGGIFVRRIENLTEEDLILFQSVARVVLTDSAETLRDQVERRYVPRRLPPPFLPSLAPARETPAPLPARERLLCNALGGFTPDGREYVITLEPGQTTPAPWANVIASPFIGTVVSESGGMYSWAGNAHEFRLTNWHNDPVSDPSGETFYLRDEESGQFWSLAPLPAPGRAGYTCRHGFGYSVFEHEEAGLFTEAWTYVAMDAPIKFVVVKIRNRSARPRRLSLFAFHELVLGEWRHANLMHVQTEVDPRTGALFAHNPYNRDFPGRVVFASAGEHTVALSGSRTEFLGRNGAPARPAALAQSRLSGRTGAGFDPAAALQAGLDLAEGQERQVVFTLGAAADPAEAQGLLKRFSGPAGARAALEAVWAHWNRVLGAVYLETPDAPLNFLANGWLLYQTLSCRIWGRSGYYQSGGAFGFRDQLQDALALMHAAPQVLRDQILLCASRQFREGDVQHWWHPPGGAGVRTRFSDDFLWLPYALARYVRATGDTGVLEETVTFLEGRPLNPGEESHYDQHPVSSESATLYEHAARAIRHGLRFGAHGLPLIGCGDWNDGMNRIGKDGRGESVWLAWFLCDTLRRFAEVARTRQDEPFATLCLDEAEKLAARTEAAAWDGDWYLRAFYDDGEPLGAARNDECQIDSIAQSWAVLSGAAQPDRAHRAMQAVRERLVRADDKLLLLFDPPFSRTGKDPGYIKAYPPGIRENGGQYTHAAIWAVIAFTRLGEHKLAWDLFGMLNPIAHGDSPGAIARYRVEPYVMAADVYSAPPHTGRGGWTWYTGAAGWMYQLAVETLLGLDWQCDRLLVAPRLPPDAWPSFNIHYRYRETFYHIEILLDDTLKAGDRRVCVDGVDQPDGLIPLEDNRRDHTVTVRCGRALL